MREEKSPDSVIVKCKMQSCAGVWGIFSEMSHSIDRRRWPVQQRSGRHKQGYWWENLPVHRCCQTVGDVLFAEKIHDLQSQTRNDPEGRHQRTKSWTGNL